MPEYNTLGAVDLGSNSFHLAIGRVVGEQIYPLDSLNETVRLGAGLGADKRLDDDTQERALGALRQFAERLAGMPRGLVRVVGTNALRVAKNSKQFVRKAESALGFPIEVISGHEEARLIYLGVAHSLPLVEHNRLVVDIGGGSTECIIGQKMKPRTMESLYMGCVSYTSRFFPGGKVDKKAMKNAELAARELVQTIAERFEALGWDEAVGSSGTARSLAEVMEKNGVSDQGITAAGLEWLREEPLSAGDFRKLSLEGLKEDRIPVIAGGTAIMSAVFAELGLEEMKVADGALRDGVLWDLLGRVHHRDIREVSIDQFGHTHHIDAAQAARVRDLALVLLKQVAPDASEQLVSFLDWAARLHEVGMSIAHGQYHKHSAYILAFADMPGFSRLEQGYLSNLVLAQRGKLAKMREAFDDDPRLATLAFCLRTAVIFYRSRRSFALPKMEAEARAEGYRLRLPRDWLEDNTLVWHALEEEREQWRSVGLELTLDEA